MNINQTITLFVGGGDCSLTFSLKVLRCAGRLALKFPRRQPDDGQNRPKHVVVSIT